MPAVCSVMLRWQLCQCLSSTPLTSSMLSFVRCRFTPGFHRASGRPLRVNTRPCMNDSGARFARASSRLSSRHGAPRTEMTTAHRPRVRRADTRIRRPMEIFQYDRGEKSVGRFGSRGFLATRIAAGEGKIDLTCLTLEPDGLIGTHPATNSQLFLVISGEGSDL